MQSSGSALLCVLVIGMIFHLFPVEAQMKKENEQAVTDYLDTVNLNSLRFRCLGPTLTLGRISDLAVHPDKSSTYYITTSSGGGWKTTNAGINFQPVFDQEGSYSIEYITIDPNNTNIL